MTSATLQLILQLKDQASSGLKAAQATLSGLADGARNAAAGIQSFAAGALQFAAGGLIQKGIEGVAAAIGDLKQGLIGGNAEFERYTVQFGVLLGSADAAKTRLKDLAQFGASTPFELPEVVRADKILQSFGLHAVDAAQKFGKSGEQIRTIAGDVAAGTGASFEEISNYIGKFSSGATGETIARFQELGIVTKQQLAQMGLAFDKGGSLIINSQEELDKATGILLQAMQQKYGGMMAAQSNTFEGMVSNLQDWRASTLRTIGQPLFEVAREKLQLLLAWLPTIQPQIDAFAQRLAGSLKSSLEWLSTTGIPAAVRGWQLFQSGLSALGTMLQPWIAGLFALGDAAIRVGQSFQKWGLETGLAAAATVAGHASAYFGGLIRDALDPLYQRLLAAPGAIGTFTRGLTSIVQYAQELSGAFQAGGIQAALGVVLDDLLSLGAQAATAIQAALPQIMAALAGWKDAASQALKDAAPGMLARLGELAGQLGQWALDQLPTLIDHFMGWRVALLQWALDAAPGAIQALATLVEQIAGAIRQHAPALLERAKAWALVIAQSLSESWPAIQTALQDVIGRLGGAIGGASPGLQEQLKSWANQFIAWIGPMIPPFLAELQKMIGQAWQAILDAAPGVRTQLGEWAVQFLGWVGENAPTWGAEFGKLAGAGLAELIRRAPEVLSALAEWSGQFGSWMLSDGLPAMISAIGGIADGLWNALVELGLQVGPALVDGIGKALSDPQGLMKFLNPLGGGLGGLGGFKIPGFAGGVRNFSGGLALVGERGPELVRLPGGSDVIPFGTGSFGGGVGGGSVAISMPVTVVSNDPDAIVQRIIGPLRDELERIAARNVTSGVV